MKLNPKNPPGRANRKALAFAIEIARLHKDGYSGEAIREALADVGVIVSKSTVQREVARLSRQALPAAQRNTAGAGDHASPTSLPQTAAHRLADESRSGKEIAEGFVKGRITNPLIRTRSRDEDSRH
jgi:hypothetical protein